MDSPEAVAADLGGYISRLDGKLRTHGRKLRGPPPTELLPLSILRLKEAYLELARDAKLHPSPGSRARAREARKRLNRYHLL